MSYWVMNFRNLKLISQRCIPIRAYNGFKVRNLESICLARLIERSEFKKAEHSIRRDIISSNVNGNVLLYCNKVFSYKKKKKNWKYNGSIKKLVLQLE